MYYKKHTKKNYKQREKREERKKIYVIYGFSHISIMFIMLKINNRWFAIHKTQI